MNTTEVIAEYVFGLVPVDDLPALGIKFLEAGFDSPSLRQVAGSTDLDPEHVRKQFSASLGELGLPIPSVANAGLTIARKIAGKVVDKTISPYAGAKQIWVRVYTQMPDLQRLRPFVGLASEYEDDVKHRGDYENDIIVECEKLLSEATGAAR